MKIVAFDLATQTGWAVGPASPVAPHTALEAAAAGQSADIAYGTYRFGRDGDPHARRFLVASQWFARILDEQDPIGVAFEAAFVGHPVKIPAVRLLFGYRALLLAEVARRKISFVLEVENQSAKRHMTGAGNATKQRMIEACQARGWSPANDDEGDALAILDYGRTVYATKRAA